MKKTFTGFAVLLVLLMASLSFAQPSARLQVIHNSADPAAEYVDVYLWNGDSTELVVKLDNFQFRTATPFVSVPAGDSLAVIVADSSSTDVETGVITTIPVGALAAEETYVVVANGVVGTGFAANPDGRDIAFELLVKAGAREAALEGGVDFFALHGATDAPTVDVIARDVATLVDDAAYTDMTDYVNVPAAWYLLDVTPADSSQAAVATFEADLSSLEGGSAVVFASGFLTPASNNDGPAFGLFAALANGTVVEFPLVQASETSARLQVIHNSADPAADFVDVYLQNGSAYETVVKLDNFTFRTATPFVDVPAEDSLYVVVADTSSTGPTDGVIATIPVGRLTPDETYVVFANGVVGEGFAANPDGRDIGFELLVKAGWQESAAGGGVDFFALHGATDAPTVDVIARDVATLVDDAAYTDMTGTVNVPAAAYVLDITPGADNETILLTYWADLSGLDSASAVVFASGFLDPSSNNNGPAFGLFAALPTGDVVAFQDTSVARLQMIHNSPDAAAAYVDIYLLDSNDSLVIEKGDNIQFRMASPTYFIPADEQLSLVIADSASTGPDNGVVTTIPVGPFTSGIGYVAIASGLIAPGSYAANPDGISTAFQILAKDSILYEASTDTSFAFFVVHGATDAPTVDVLAVGVGTLVDDAAYTDITGYIEVPAASYELAVTPGDDNQTVVGTFGADLSGLGGGTAVVFASGFLDPAQNGDGPAFGLFAALPNGDVVTFNPVTETEVLFQVDMTVQIFNGNFVEGGQDTLDVRGSFNGWSQNSDYFMDENDLVDNVYELLLTDYFPLGVTQYYKHVITHDGSTIWENRPNREFTITGSEPDNNNNGIPEKVLDLVYFDDIGADQIFLEETAVVFEVDMGPAHRYLAANGSIAFGGETITTIDSVYIASGATNTDPQMGWVWDLTPGDPIREALQMNDDGLDGDAVAGDSIWSITVTFQPGAAKVFTWKHGIFGIDNEAGFAANHSEDLPNYPGFPTIRKLFGENGDFYDDYLSSIDNGGVAKLPTEFALNQNFPNPFNPTTTIEFALKQQADVSIEIFNLLGQRIRTLVNDTRKAGVYQVVWDATNDFGQRVGTGIYFYKIEAGDFIQTKKMVLMK